MTAVQRVATLINNRRPRLAREANPIDSGRLRQEIIIIKDLASFEILRAGWDALVASGEDVRAYMTFEYCKIAVARALAEGDVVVIAAVRVGREFLAIWPLTIRRKGLLRIANRLTCGTGEEYGGPIVGNRQDRAATRAALDAVLKIQADVFDVGFVEDDSVVEEALECAPQSWLLSRLPKGLDKLPGYSIRFAGSRSGRTSWPVFRARFAAT